MGDIKLNLPDFVITTVSVLMTYTSLCLAAEGAFKPNVNMFSRQVPTVATKTTNLVYLSLLE